MKIAILYICTGDYVVFWKLFYLTFKKNFLRKCNVHFYVFTDLQDVEYSINEDVHLYHIENREWPYSTLLRFHTFLKVEEEIRQYDYCFFMNANMLCMKEICEEEFLPIKEDLLVVKHPGSFRISLKDWNWERNPESTAYIECGKEEVYVCGGINGGKANAFIDMALELSKRIDEDMAKGIIAKVHDESHLNRYILDYPNYRLLGCQYVYPEAWALPIEQKIMLVDKRWVIDINKIKEDTSYNEKLGMMERKTRRLEQYFEVLKQLLYCRNHGANIPEYLRRCGFNRIAIYGYKNLGEILLDEIKDSDIIVKYIIDNKIKDQYMPIQMVKDSDIMMFSDVDCIIVCALYDYYRIYRKWIDTTNIPILSLEFIVHEVYMFCNH